MVSIHGPLGYGPSTLPLRHSATDETEVKRLQFKLSVQKIGILEKHFGYLELLNRFIFICNNFFGRKDHFFTKYVRWRFILESLPQNFCKKVILSNFKVGFVTYSTKRNWRQNVSKPTGGESGESS